MDTTDYQRAANSARQLVRQALDLQSLHGVLDEIAGNAQSLQVMPQRIAALQAQEAEQRDRLTQATADAENASKNAKEVYREQLVLREQQLSGLQLKIAGLEQREKELTSSVEALERQCGEIRERLRVAVA